MRKAFERFLEVAGTRGFWTVNVFWFAAGGFFFATLPEPKHSTGWLNDILITTLLLIALLPVYWTMVLDLSRELNDLIDNFFKRKN